jgi:putative chitinase
MGLIDILLGFIKKPSVDSKRVDATLVKPSTPLQGQYQTVPSKPSGVGIRVDHLLGMGVSQTNAEKYVGYLNDACERFQINTNARICAFIAQTCEESGNLSVISENLNYRPDVIVKLWPKFSYEVAKEACDSGPEAVGNLIYGNRMGNVNPGDGYKYRGRGFIQLTGRDNYALSSKFLGVDLVNNPDLVLQPEYCALTAAEYWQRNGCNELSDPDNEQAVEMVTKRINGGYINLDIRLANWRKAKRVFADIK